LIMISITLSRYSSTSADRKACVYLTR
jgi:hypothetical protein